MSFEPALLGTGGRAGLAFRLRLLSKAFLFATLLVLLDRFGAIGLFATLATSLWRF